MTAMIKQQVEKQRQMLERHNMTLKDADMEFRPTSNDRNNAMLSESQRFAQALRALTRDLTDVDAKVTGA